MFTFWIVMKQEKNRATRINCGKEFTHPEAAVAHAKLLASKYPGDTYFVMESITAYSVPEPPPPPKAEEVTLVKRTTLPDPEQDEEEEIYDPEED